MQGIEKLPRSVHSSLQASVLLFDLPRVVEELTYNSIGADAKKVDVHVNIKSCYVKVEDDGCGLDRDELVTLGEKCGPISKYSPAMIDEEFSSTVMLGSRREVMGSLSDISVVEVRTKARGKPNSYCKIIKGSKCLYLGIDDQREKVGTTVIVRDLFYNQPVRRKCMQASQKRIFHSVKKCVLQAALVHPWISFRVVDIGSNSELLSTVPSSTPLPLVSNCFGNDVTNCLHEISSSYEGWKLSGYVSGPMDLFSTQAFQYIYVNSRFIDKSPIHHMLNSLAASVQYSAVKTDDQIEFQSRKRQKSGGYPAYLLNLGCKVCYYDLNYEPTKTAVEFKDWNPVLSFVELAVRNLWKQLMLQPLGDEPIPDNSAFSARVKDRVPTHGGKRKKSQIQTSRSCQENHSEATDSIMGDLNVHASSLSCILDEERSSILSHWPAYSSPQTNSKIQDNLKLDIGSTTAVEIGTSDWLEDDPFQLEDITCSEPKYFERTSCEKESILWENPPDNVGSLRDSSFFSWLDDNQELLETDRVQYGKAFHDDWFDAESYSCIKSDDCKSSHSSFYDLDNKHVNPRVPFVCEAEYRMNDKLFNVANGNIKCDVMGNSAQFCSLRKCANTTTTTTRTKGRSIYDEACYCSMSNFPSVEDILENDTMSFKKDTAQGDSSPHFASDPERTFIELDKNLNGCSDYWGREMDEDCENVAASWNLGAEDQPENGSIFELDTNFMGEASKHSHDLFHDLTCDDQCTSRNQRTEGNPVFCCSSQTSSNSCQQKYESSQICNIETRPDSSLNEVRAQYSHATLRFKGTRRYHSAPPVYRGRPKFSILSDLTMKFRNKMSRQLNEDFAGTKCSRMEASVVCASQPLPVNAVVIPHSNIRGSPDEMQKSIDELFSPNEHEDGTEGNVKWRDDYLQTTVLNTPWKSLERNPDVLDISSGILHLSSSSLVPECIDRHFFDGARVLLQLDRKFIPVVSNEILIIVDQHAADERIRLEELRRKVLSGEGCGITYLESEEDLVLPEMGFQFLQEYADLIQKWGWISNFGARSTDAFTKNMSLLKKHACVATLVAVPCILGINLSGQDLVEFIEQLIETDGSSSIPPSVLRVLNLKACRGAIMFGDRLLPSECKLIVEELKSTSLSLQCAHGRPTAIPMVNLSSLCKELSKLDVQFNPIKAWHGLSHQSPSVERAMTRLNLCRTRLGRQGN